jgi:hypothetical protein
MKIDRLVIVLIVVAAAVVLTQSAGAEDKEGNAIEYKTVFVPTVLAPTKQLGESETEVNGPQLAKDVDAAIRQLTREGYVVESTIPVISGMYRWASQEPIKRSQSASASAFGYGYSVTSGVTIIARRD